MTLGDVIKEYRKEQEISLRDFALLSGLSHTYISALEKNIDPRTNKPIAPTIDTLKAVAHAICIEPDDLLKILDNEQPIEFNSTDNLKIEQNLQNENTNEQKQTMKFGDVEVTLSKNGQITNDDFDEAMSFLLQEKIKNKENKS